jgi:hypothetical protein
MRGALLDPARHVKARILRAFRGEPAPLNLQSRDPAALENDVVYAMQVAKEYLNQLEAVGLPLSGLSILELGPGTNSARN